jgi:hypothetical protein
MCELEQLELDGQRRGCAGSDIVIVRHVNRCGGRRRHG